MLDLRKNYNPWKVSKRDFPADRSIKEKMRFLLRYAVLAPSSLNTQPWEFKLTNNSIVVLADKSKRLKVADPTMRDFYISIGCAITNIIEAAEGLSLETDLKLINTYRLDRCAEIFVRESSKEPNKDSLIDFIPHRFSDKGLYNKKSLAKSTYDTLAHISNNSCSVILISDSSIKSEIINLAVEADRRIMSNIQFREEISRWLIPNFSNSTLGMPGFTMGLNLFQSIVSPYIVRGFKNFADIQSKRDREVLLSSPYLGIVSTDIEEKINLLEAGMLYEKMCLYATKSSVRINPLSAIIEFEVGKDKLRTLFGSKRIPVMFFRVGYSNNKEIHSPRAGYET